MHENHARALIDVILESTCVYICICRAGYVVALILRHLNRRFDIHCNNSLSEGAGALTFVAAVQRSSLEVYVAIDCRFFLVDIFAVVFVVRWFIGVQCWLARCIKS